MLTRNCFTVLMIVLIIAVFITVCRNDKKITKPDEDEFSQAVVDNEGGYVTDAYGASITVPASAVTSDMTISVRTIQAGSVPEELQSAVVGNMIECLPDGAEFLKPVTIVLPVTSEFTYQPGDTANLYHYSADSAVWEMTDIPAFVTPDGRHFQASVTHFSNYGTNTSGGYSGSRTFFFINSDDLLVKHAGYWADSFVESLGGLHAKKMIQDCCMELANVSFSFRFTSPEYSGTCQKMVGEWAMCDKLETMHADEGNPDPVVGYHMHIMIQICWVACDSDMQLSISPNHFEVPEDKDQTASITASVTCGSGQGFAFAGQSVKFVIVDGPGRVDPPMTRTDGSGTATGTYTVEKRGIASIRSEVQTCSSINPVTTTRTAQVVVDTVMADQFDAIIRIHHGGSDMPWTFNDEIHIEHYLQFDEETVSISGGVGMQGATCTATDAECSIRSLSAPSFDAKGKVTKRENALDIELNPSVPINFNYYCDFGDDDIINEPVPAYGFMVSTIIAKYVKGTIQMEDCSTIRGGGAESFGEDLPVSYEWELIFIVNKHP